MLKVKYFAKIKVIVDIGGENMGDKQNLFELYSNKTGKSNLLARYRKRATSQNWNDY